MKKNVLLASLAFAIVFTACDKKPESEVRTDATQDTAVLFDHSNGTAGDTANMSNDDYSAYDWGSVDQSVKTIPPATYPEVASRDITIRGNDRYSVYELGDNILFPLDKATLNTAAENNLKEVAASIKQRYPNGWIRLYGFTDSTYTKEYNKELAEQRAEAVKQWFVANGVRAGRISVHSMGQQNPVATNETAKGRQKNRRVEIVAGNR